MKKENTNNETGFFNKIKSFFLQFLYGISITVPTSSNYSYKGVFIIILISSWFNLMMLLYPLFKLDVLSTNGVFLLSSLLAIIVFILAFININIITNHLDKIWAEKYYWLDINSHKEENYSELIRTHRNNNKYNRIKYMKNDGLIKEYKKYNIKWRLIAIVYLIITILNIYLTSNLDL